MDDGFEGPPPLKNNLEKLIELKNHSHPQEDWVKTIKSDPLIDEPFKRKKKNYIPPLVTTLKKNSIKDSPILKRDHQDGSINILKMSCERTAYFSYVGPLVVPT